MDPGQAACAERYMKMKTDDQIFVNYILLFLEKTPTIQHEWRNNDTEVIFKKNNDNGFDVVIGHNKNILYLYTDRGFHNHFEAYRDFSNILEQVMGLARNLLSNNMRIREISSNNNARKWILEHYRNNAWEQESINGLILWNYFGKKTEKIYSNDIYPAGKS